MSKICSVVTWYSRYLSNTPMIFFAYVFALLVTYLGQLYPNDTLIVSLLLTLDTFALLLTFSMRISALFEKKEILGLVNYPSGSLTVIFGIIIANSIFLMPINLIVFLSSPDATGLDYFIVLISYSISYMLLSSSLSLTLRNVGSATALSLIYLLPVVIGGFPATGGSESLLRHIVMISPISGSIFVPTIYYNTLLSELIFLMLVGIASFIIASWNFGRSDIL